MRIKQKEREKHRSPPKFDSIIVHALDVLYSCTAYIDVRPWASIIGWTGGQVPPPLFEVGGRNVFCPPTFWGNKYLQ